jgi:hypothetical protein
MEIESKEALRQKLRNKINGFRQKNEKPTITPKLKKDVINELKKLPKSLQNEMQNLIKTNGNSINKQQINDLLNKVNLNKDNESDKKQIESINSTLLNKVEPVMDELYEKVCLDFKDSNISIPKPIELLNNPNKAKDKFKEYLENVIETCKKNAVPKESFIKDYLNSSYTKYYVGVLGREIIPEKLSLLIE